MAQTPDPKSLEQILGEMLAYYSASTGVNDFNIGSLTTQLFETVALSVARSSGDAFQILRDLSVDRAEGEPLKRIAQDEGLREIPARPATGTVKITDTSFTKKSTKIYAGTKAPNIGSTIIFVSDASAFPASGNIYIGRGSPNVEGPITYTAKAPVGTYWQLTLATPTTKFHNINESVILAQGGTRTIPQGTVVKVPATGAENDINFSVSQAASILDGEVEVNGVQVTAQEPGVSGNIPIGAIKAFGSPPFAGASVTNLQPFNTGRDVESDNELKIRIKRARLSRGLGTALAVKNSVIGASPSDENAIVVSSEIVTANQITTLFIDDGTGYEQKTQGVGLEVLNQSAIGGEFAFQLETGGRQTSIAKAFIVSNLSAPFDVREGDKLAVTVGGKTTEHNFLDSDFVSPGGATAYEIVASINANNSLNFEATTSEGGTKVLLQAKTEINEDIQIAEVSSGRNVADLLEFPSNKFETLKLFKNKKSLSKDGVVAIIESAKQSDWSNLITNGDTLILAVDGTDPITYTITDSDFVAEGTYTTVSASNSLDSWVNVFNKKLTGVTAAILGERITLTSNLGTSDRAKVEIINTSTLVTKNMFNATEGLVSVGQNKDYDFSRNTGQIKLKKPLVAGDELIAGIRDSEARIESSRIIGGSITISANAYFWVLWDDPKAEIINTGVVANSIINVSKPTTNIVRYNSSVATAFNNVQVGDYVIIWSPELNANNRLEGRVHAVTSTNLDIKVTPAEFAAAVAETGVVFQDGFVVVRTEYVPQKVKIVSGTSRLITDIADEIDGQLDNGRATTIDDEIIVLNTLTKTDMGAILFITADNIANLLGFKIGDSDKSKNSQIAFLESGYRAGSFPICIHSNFSNDGSALPPDSYLTSINSTLNWATASLDPNYSIGFLQPYGSILDVQPPKEIVELNNFSGAALTLTEDKYLKRLRQNDRYYIASPLEFDFQDNLVVSLDGDLINKTFDIPLYRKAATNTTHILNPNNFNAYDTDAGPTSSFTLFFNNFDFSNFKLLMKAKRVIDGPVSEDALLFRATKWGKSGEFINIAYKYPSFPNSNIQHTVVYDKNVDVRLFLKSGNPVVTTIDGTTEWNVTITANTPVAGVDQVTFTWSGVGTAPGLSSLSGGEYVNIGSGSELDPANTGIFRVSTEVGFAPTATSFTAVMKNGVAVAQSGVATLVPSVFSFYQASNTTASDIDTYVNANLSGLITSSIVNDGGTSGAGVISLSTEEESDFSIESYFLRDGINWILSSNVSGTPQFTLKKPLSYISDTGYAFNQGEELRLVPTNIKQTVDFLNILAVTGLTTLGKIKLSSNENKMQIHTNIIGSAGAIQAAGGLANKLTIPVIGSAVNIDYDSALANFNRPSLSGFISDQWVKLTAKNKQKKDTLIKDTASILIDGNFPTTGQSTIYLKNRTLTDRHFGSPRHHIRTRSRSFKIEKQGDLTCLSWDGVGTQPFFFKNLNLNLTGSGTLNIEKITGTSEANVYILTGPLNFTEIYIGDKITIQNMDNPENDGTFVVTGVSDDGKTLRILNPKAVNEFSTATINIINNANVNGDSFTIGSTTLTVGTLAVPHGVSAADTAANLAAAIALLPNVTATSSGSVVTIEATIPNASISLSYTDVAPTGGATISGSSLVGRSYAIGDFNASSEVTEGDQVKITAPFNILNRGKFRVIRRYQNSIYFENKNTVEEQITLPANLLTLGYTGSTQFNIDASNNKIYLKWNGVGTEPTLGIAEPGDELVLGTDFSTANQGTFTIINSGEKLKEITRVTLPSAAAITGSPYWLINAAGDTTEYYVWYDKDGTGVDPALVGKTGIEVDISTGDSAAVVANATAAAIDALTTLDATASGNKVTISTTGFAETTDATSGTMPSSFSVEILQQGRRTFVEAINPAAVTQTGVSITDVLEIHRPQIKFWEYEATLDGDKFFITDPFAGVSNVGGNTILKVINRDTIIVSGTKADTETLSLIDVSDSVFVEEEKPYVGYKKIKYIANNVFNNNIGSALFTTYHQFNKINESAEVTMHTINKLNFSTRLFKGVDSYRYHTGLIGEANRIVYGEPRDPVTYPGVSAAGAEIFIREPLIRRVKLSIDVRIQTGVPFAQIVEEVRTNITALVNSNPIGQSIAISDIVETVNRIPGVQAVAISSPIYDAANDLLKINPSEKSKILDPVIDISVQNIT